MLTIQETPNWSMHIPKVGHAVLDSDAGYSLMAGDITTDMEDQSITTASVSISGYDLMLDHLSVRV